MKKIFGGFSVVFLRFVLIMIVGFIFIQNPEIAEAVDVYATETNDYVCYIESENIKETKNGFYVIVKEVFKDEYLKKNPAQESKYRRLCYEFAYIDGAWHIETEHFWNVADHRETSGMHKYFKKLEGDGWFVAKAVFEVANKYRK